MLNLKLLKELRDRTNIGMNECKKALQEANNDIDIAISLLKKWGELKGKEKSSVIATEGMVVAKVDHFLNIGVIVEVNSQTDFMSRNQDFRHFVNRYIEHLLCLDDFVSADAKKIEDLRHKLIATTGENVVALRFNRCCCEGKKNLYLVEYNHPGNKLSVLVEFQTPTRDKEFIEFANDVALQIAAMNPIAVSKNDIPSDVLEAQMDIFKCQLKEENKPEHTWAKIIEGKFVKWRKENVLLEQSSLKDDSKSVSQIMEELKVKLNVDIKISRFFRYSLGEGIEKKQEDFASEVEKLIGS